MPITPSNRAAKSARPTSENAFPNGAKTNAKPDQDFGRNDSIFVNFFGIPTATITGLSRIAGMTKAKVIPAIPTRNADNTVTLRFYPAWENFPSDDVAADTQRMNDFIEARARENPEQYFWLHKRFKTRPEGEQGFY